MKKFTKDFRMGIRLSEEQRKKVFTISSTKGIKPSAYIRYLIDNARDRNDKSNRITDSSRVFSWNWFTSIGDEMNELIYDIADEYLPDVTILGIDGPNTGLAGDIVDKVLDAVCAEVNNVGLGVHNEKATITAINKLRSEK